MRQLAAGAAAAAGVPGCVLEVRVAVVDGLDLDVLVLVRVAQEGADVKLEGDALVRADRAGRELDLDDGVRVLLALLDIRVAARAQGRGDTVRATADATQDGTGAARHGT